jgi:type III secretion protein U
MSSSAEKTEQPTPKKLSDARKKGEVAKSKEVSSTFGFISVIALLWYMSDTYIITIQEMVLLPTTVYTEPFYKALDVVIHGILQKTIELILPLVVVAMVAAILGNVIQFGFLFAAESIKPDIKKINPISGFKKIFSMKNLVEFIKSIIKILFLSYVVYDVLYTSMGDMVHLPHCGTSCMLPMTGSLLKKLLLYAALAFIIISVVDYLFERFNFMKQNRMSKDEVKREYKENDGNPEIKQKRKQIHQEMVNSAENTKQSDVVIKNPTHLAIGLRYRENITPLPVVTVKGRGGNAKFIVNIAEQKGIPVLENVPLAHALFHLDVTDFIPSDLIEPVAEVFRWVQEIKPQEEDDIGDSNSDLL